MLRIYPVSLELARGAAEVAQTIAVRDVDLARQLRRAVSSIPLNLAEGAGTSGGHRRQRYLTALGSAREVMACLETGHMIGYCGSVSPMMRNAIDHIIGTLVRLTH